MPLNVADVHLFPLENAKAHNCSKYQMVQEKDPKTTIVRRGQEFKGRIQFKTPFNEVNDVVQLVFSLGNKQHMETMGKMFIRRDAVPDKHSWSAKLISLEADKKTLLFNVTSPVTAPVGAWDLSVMTSEKGSRNYNKFPLKQKIYVLFNPWNSDDQTFMEEQALLQEYVLNDVGKVWCDSSRGSPWLFGQFNAAVLPACMFMLDRAKLPLEHRGDPIKMTRAISRIVNANDDRGVLIGRWDGKYENGTSPSQWTSSVDILKKFLETKNSVAYGQCWVFACVTNAVCRALGIPCRVVSNFVSAHDVNGNLTIDRYYSETMEELGYDPTNAGSRNIDSIWNFHVWNDAWMARPDLTPGFGGWQAIDATPQELSNGTFQCGPAPLKAIKEGILGMNYDVEFVLASVNADLVRWRVDPTSETGYSFVESDTYHIGRMILTKKPYVFDARGEKDREDVVDQYKYKEGTASERVAYMNGVGLCERARRYYTVMNDVKKDVTFKLRDLDTVPIGKPFSVTVDIENTANVGRHITAGLSATSVYYNGVGAELVKKIETKLYVEPGKKTHVSIEVEPEAYLPKLVEHCNMKISAVAIVDETKQCWADNDDFKVIKPNISIEFNKDLVMHQPSEAHLSITNPLDTKLTRCEFRLSSLGTADHTVEVQTGDVRPFESLLVKVPIKPNKLGAIDFVATFKSVELKEIRGAATKEVKA